MRMIKQLTAIDSHTMGEPTRIIVSGIPVIPGKTMAEKKDYLVKNLDHIRTAVMHEPRGHNDMFGSIITAPCSDEADAGIIFMDGGGYLNMCGHGTIGAMTALCELGYVEVTEPVTKVVLDAPAGLVHGEVKIENNKAKEVSFRNVPSFFYKADVKINIPDLGEITVDISFGGSFFCLLEASQIGLDLSSSNSKKILEVGMKILKNVNSQIKVQHPELAHIKTIDLVEIYGPAQVKGSNLRNAVIFGDGQLDRSPCGTGTSAKIAMLYAKGELKENELFVYESVIGTQFKGKIVEVLGKKDGYEYPLVIPEITASAFITGINQIFIDPDDPVKYGFTLG